MPDASFSLLRKTIKEIVANTVNSTNPSGLYYGEVTSESPLKILIEQKMTLTEDFLILSTLVREFDVDMTVDHWTEDETEHIHAVQDTYTGSGTSSPTAHKHAYKGRKKFTVHLGLKAGEKVILLRVQGGQKYLVLDRVR